jgi:hypothetical protein
MFVHFCSLISSLILAEIVSDVDSDNSASFNVTFILRALGQWTSSAYQEDTVSLDMISILLDAIKRALIMLPPLDRDQLPQHLSKFYGKTHSLACLVL